jgi:L1 cell adhesion molecule like protein
MTTVGIDYGNINSSVAIIQNERSEVVADAGGHRQLPSVVTYNEEKKSFIGVESLKIVSRYPKSTITDLKTLLGHSLDDVQTSKTKWEFQIVQGKNGSLAAQFQFDGKETQIYPQDTLQLLLQQLKKTAEDASGDKAIKVVISHPYHSPAGLKNSLLEASKKIGWNDVHFISEQAAVILAYELDDLDENALDKQVIIIDFGTTLQISHVSILRGVIIVKHALNFPEVNNKLFEISMVKNFAGEFQRKNKLDINESKRSVIRLAAECDRVKGVLSQVQQASANVEGLMEGIDFSSSITRAKFEMINSSAFQLFTVNMKQALSTIGIDPDIIILSGGNCKIPKIQQIIQNQFPDKKILSSIDPSEAIAKGAALQAKYLQDRNPMVHGKKVKKISSFN